MVIKKLLNSNTFWSLGSNGLTALLGFANLALIAQNYSKSDTGKWFMLLSFYTILEMLRSGLVQTPFIRYYISSESNEDKNKLIAAAWHILLFFTLFQCVFLLPFILFYSITDTAFDLTKQQIIIWMLASLPYQLVQWQLHALSEFKKLAIIRLIFPILFSVLLVYNSYSQLPIFQIALYYALLQFFIGIISITINWLKFGTWKYQKYNEWKTLTGFGKFSMLTMVSATLLRSSDQFIIAAWLGPTAVAIYSIPQKLIEAIEIPVRSFASVAIAKATTLFNARLILQLKEFFYKQCATLLLLIAPIIAVFLVLPKFIVQLIGGNSYIDSATILQILCFYAILIPIDRYCGVLLDATGNPKNNTIKVILMLIINIIGDYLVLYLGYGIFGVAAVSTLTFLFGVVYGLKQINTILQKLSFKDFWNFGLKSLLNQINLMRK